MLELDSCKAPYCNYIQDATFCGSEGTTTLNRAVEQPRMC
jgi:hypothetical protein